MKLNTKKIVVIIQILVMSGFVSSLFSQKKERKKGFQKPTPDKVVTYKKLGDIELKLHIFNPKDHKNTHKTPCIVFIHGGGWNGGSWKHFARQSAYIASRGMVAISIDYRTKKDHGTSPKECVKDAKSAMRWVKSHASELGIDPDKIVAGGGSAGGHLAASVATLSKFNEEGEDTSVSCVPKAMVLFNPVVDCGPGSKPHKRIKEYWQDISPFHNLSKNTPPCIVFQGTADEIVNYKSIEKFAAKMKELGIRCDAHFYKDQPHSFFNKTKFYETVLEMDKFLISIGYLKGKPTIGRTVKF